MRVLFICRANSEAKIGVVTRNQADSLLENGIELVIFPIEGNGLMGYLKSVKKLKRVIKERNPDVYHAHYLWSGVVATLARCKPLVVSLMGSDLYSNGLNRLLCRTFSQISWNRTIVKSNGMYSSLGVKSAIVIPNGVNIKIFKPSKNSVTQKKSNEVKKILFIGKPERPEKNIKLAIDTLSELKEEKAELLNVFDKSPAEVAELMNSVDLVLLTSVYEGSPNVIKEAMSCNCPIVATDVGDVRYLFDNVEGCYVSNNEPADLAGNIRKVFKMKGPANGRNRILELGFDSDNIAQRLIQLYESIKYDDK